MARPLAVVRYHRAGINPYKPMACMGFDKNTAMQQSFHSDFFFVLRSLAGTNFVWSTVHRGFRSVRRVRDGAQPNKVCDSACAWELALLHF